MNAAKMMIALVLCASSASALADSIYLDERGDRRYTSDYFDRNEEFSESQVALPEVPSPKSGDWFDLYVDNTFAGKPRLLLSSVTYAPDGSVRYIINNRSAGGADNVSAEGLLCITGTKLLDSEGSRVKTFAYADLFNYRWIVPRKAEWQTLGGKLNSNDKVRRVLYDAFCIDGRAKSDEALRERIRAQSGWKNDFSK